MVAFIKVAFLFAVATSALPDAKRARATKTFSDVTTDLSALSTSLATLSNSITAYTTASLFVQILPPAIAVETQTNKTRDDANASPVATADQAQTICDYFKNTLIPAIKKTLDVLVGKKAQLAKDGNTSLARQKLLDLSKAAQSLATALISKAPSAKTSCASSASSAVISLFNSALATII